MKKKSLMIIWFILIIILIACSNNTFEINTTITPKLTDVGSRIAVEYMLGDLMILDEWKGLNAAEFLFLTQKDKPLDVKLNVAATDGGGCCTVVFEYIIANIRVKTQPVSLDILLDNIESIENVRWEVKNGVTMTNKKEQTNKDKLDPTNKKL